MARLDMQIPHALSYEEALTRARSIIAEMKREHADKISSVSEEWSGNTCQFSLTVMGNSISGTLNVGSSDISLSGKIPFAASFFSGKIKSIIRGVAERKLSA